MYKAMYQAANPMPPVCRFFIRHTGGFQSLSYDIKNSHDSIPATTDSSDYAGTSCQIPD